MTLSSSSRSFPSPAAPVQSGSWWSKLSQTLTAWGPAKADPSIMAITDSDGQTWWKAYNPKTRQLQWFTSQAEVMLWLEAQQRL